MSVTQRVSQRFAGWIDFGRGLHADLARTGCGGPLRRALCVFTLMGIGLVPPVNSAPPSGPTERPYALTVSVTPQQFATKVRQVAEANSSDWPRRFEQLFAVHLNRKKHVPNSLPDTPPEFILPPVPGYVAPITGKWDLVVRMVYIQGEGGTAWIGDASRLLVFGAPTESACLTAEMLDAELRAHDWREGADAASKWSWIHRDVRLDAYAVLVDRGRFARSECVIALSISNDPAISVFGIGNGTTQDSQQTPFYSPSRSDVAYAEQIAALVKGGRFGPVPRRFEKQFGVHLKKSFSDGRINYASVNGSERDWLTVEPKGIGSRAYVTFLTSDVRAPGENKCVSLRLVDRYLKTEGWDGGRLGGGYGWSKGDVAIQALLRDLSPQEFCLDEFTIFFNRL